MLPLLVVAHVLLLLGVVAQRVWWVGHRADCVGKGGCVEEEEDRMVGWAAEEEEEDRMVGLAAEEGVVAHGLH